MTENKKQKLIDALKSGKIKDETSLAVFEMVTDMEDKVDGLEQSVADAIKQVKESEVSLDKVLESVKGQKGDTGEKGDKGDKGDNGKDGKNGKDGVNGKDGKDGVNGKDGVTPDYDTIIFDTSKKVEEKLTPLLPKIEDIEKDLPKLGTSIRDSLELIDEEEEKLDIKAIKNLRKELDDLAKKVSQAGISGGVVGRDIIKDIDLSSQLDGVTKTFNIQAVWYIVSVDLSSYPYGSLRKGIDYTWTPTSITFTSEIDETTQLSSGQKLILTVVQG
jgi:hypothetical protein